MKVAILGFNLEGQAAYEYYSAKGDEITVCDRNPDVEVPEGADSQLGDNYLDNLERFDILVRSPGLYPKDILDSNPSVADKITTQTNEFLSVCPTKNIIGVTGTKGKGTTSSLIAAMLKADGKKVHIGGNIGVPVFELLKTGIAGDDWVVLEMSNFQLIDIKQSPHIGVCLMVVPEHLDWHPDSEDYFKAKFGLFEFQDENDIAVYFKQNETSTRIASNGNGKKIPYFESPGAFVEDGIIKIDGQDVCRTDELKLLGKHNWQNACAAVTAAWQVTHNISALHEALSSFVTMEHRLEFVRELDGVKYYNDSFGTTPETAMVAVEAFEEPLVLITGGSEKGADYNELVSTIFDNSVKHVICIGITGLKIAELLERRKTEKSVPYTTWDSYDNLTMPVIVAKAREQTSPGDIVLLSTGSASFDMFKNYKDRGQKFKQAVQELV